MGDEEVTATGTDDTDAYFETLVEQSKLHDEKLLWVVGGSVAVSITFLAGLLPRVAQVVAPGWLMWSWLALGASVIATFANLQVSNWGFQIRIRCAEHNLPASKAADEKKAEKFVLAVNVLNVVSVALLAAGLILLARFAYANLALPFPIPVK